MVAEGVRTAGPLLGWPVDHDVEMPIVEQVVRRSSPAVGSPAERPRPPAWNVRPRPEWEPDMPGACTAEPGISSRFARRVGQPVSRAIRQSVHRGDGAEAPGLEGPGERRQWTAPQVDEPAGRARRTAPVVPVGPGLNTRTSRAPGLAPHRGHLGAAHLEGTRSTAGRWPPPSEAVRPRGQQDVVGQGPGIDVARASA